MDFLEPIREPREFHTLEDAREHIAKLNKALVTKPIPPSNVLLFFVWIFAIVAFVPMFGIVSYLMDRPPPAPAPITLLYILHFGYLFAAILAGLIAYLLRKGEAKS